MANILLVDPADIARKAMAGILARGGHRMAAVATVEEAWRFIRENICVDLVFLELKLQELGGLELLPRLRSDSFLKLVPVVVYTTSGDRETVKQALAFKIQNFLVKPYRDEVIFGEIAKATANLWRSRHFEEEKSFCAMMGYTPATLRKALEQLHTGLNLANLELRELAKDERSDDICARVKLLTTAAEAAGAWGVVELLNDLYAQAESREWPAFAGRMALLSFAERMVYVHLHRDHVPDGFITETERNEAAEAKARAHWVNAPAEQRCPVVTWPQVAAALEALPGCPVIDSAAAAFQMSVTGRAAGLAPLMDLAEIDPGLCAQLLIVGNQVRQDGDDPDQEPMDSPRMCVNLLGDLKLAALASGLIAAESRHMKVPPCSWTNFWMFQVGVARMARYICGYLEFDSLQARAYSAGLMNDLGKLLLLHLHPYAFQAVLEHSRSARVTIAAAEQKILGCTTREMAAHFAEKHGLPTCYVNVMRWVATPAAATADIELVAVVSLAHELCRQNNVGWSGDPVKESARRIAETPAWGVLRELVFPSFDLAKFESDANAKSREIKEALRGQVKN